MPERRNKRRYLAVGLGLVLLAVLAVAAVPIVGVLGWVARIAAIACIPVFLLAVIFSPAVRDWLVGEADSPASYSGLQVPSGVLVHERHSWARVDNRRQVTAGADDLVQTVLGPVDHVVLPKTGALIAQGETLFELRSGRRSVAITSPVTGRVVATNDAVSADPKLLNASPYEDGWLVRLDATQLSRDRRRLFGINRAREWFRDEVDRLLEALSPTDMPTPVANDGGVLVDELHRQIDEPTWQRIRASFFGDTSSPSQIG